MAKQKISSDKYDLDKDIDIPDFDFDFGDVPKDRKPAEEILTGIGKGVKNSFTNTNFIRRLIRESLPPVYGETEDIVSMVGNTTSQLYNKAVKEVKPSILNVAKATDKLIPPKFKRSKDTLNKLKEWSAGQKDYSFTKEDKDLTQSKNIALEIGDIFKTTAKNQEEQYQETKAKDAIKESIDIARHNDSKSIISDIRRSVQSLSVYQDKVTQAYQKKSLELQYRSYFAQIEVLEESRKMFALSETSYKAITKNTALPEYVKIRDSEKFKELLREKTIESLFGTTHSFFSKAFKNAGNKLKDYTNIFKDGLDSAAFGADMADMGGGGGSFKENLASGGVELAIEQLGLAGGRKIRKQLGKVPKVNKIAGDASYGIRNLPELTNKWTNSYDAMDPWHISAGKNILKNLIGNQKPDTSIINDNLGEGRDPAIFTNRNSKSINEIIPGYLARILREIQVFRTGDTSIGLLAYDPYKNKFETSENIKQSFMDKLINKGSVATHHDNKDDIFKLIDPDGKISKEQRDAVMDILTKEKFNKKLISKDRLTSDGFFSDRDDRLTADESTKISEIFNEYFNKSGPVNQPAEIPKFLKRFISPGTASVDPNFRRNQLDNLTSRIGKSLNNPASEIQKLVNSGYSEQLREMGLLNEEGTAVDMEEVLRKFNSNSSSSSNASASLNSTLQPNQTTSLSGASTPQQQNNTSNINFDNLVDRITDKLADNSKELKDFLNLTRDNQKEFTDFVKINVDNLTKLDETLVKVSGEDGIKGTNSILARIEEFLLNKLPLFLAQGSQNNQTQPEQFQSNDHEASGYKKDTFFNNLTGVVGKAGSFAWNKFVKPVNRFTWDATKLGADLSWKSMKFSGRTAAKTSNWLANKLIKVKDVYIEGEDKPRLKMTGFRAGKYTDSKTGNPITSIHDLEKIEGDVMEGDNIILAREDFAKAFVKDSKGGGFIALTKFLGGKAIALGKFTSGTTIAGTIGIFKAANWLRKSALNLLDQPIDIYLKGEKDPILLAIVMKNGGYLSERTGQPITRPSQIDGPLKDSSGNYALTSEQLKKGIEDIDGKPIKTPLMKLLGFGLNVAGMGIRAAMRIGKFATDTIKGGLDKTGNFFQGIIDGITNGAGGKRSIEILEQIRDLLDSRLPKNTKSFNDTDGDGKRDGGWQTLLGADGSGGDPNKARTDDTTVKPGRENSLDKISRMAGSAKKKVLGLLGLGGDDDEDEEDGEDDTRRSRRGRRTKGRGRLGKLGKAKGIAGMLGRGAGVLGRLGLSGATMLASGGASLLGTVLPMAGSAIGAIATAVPAILGGIGAVLSSPVVLTAAAVGLAGYGAYKAYQYFTKPDYSYLVKIRMAQYGLSIDQMKQFPIVMALEDKLLKYVKTTESGVDFNIDDVLITELLKLFEIDPEKTDSGNNLLIKNWTTWFSERFKPAFSANLSALEKLKSKTSLADIDSLSGKDKELYIGIIRKASVPYDVLISPFPDAKLQAGEALVNAYADKALEEAIAQSKKDENSPDKTSKDKVTVKGALGAAGAVAGASAKDKATSAVVPPPNQSGWFSNAIQKTLNVLKSPLGLLAAISPFAALTGYAIKSIGGKLMESFGFGVTALEAVRLKTYGLKEMDRSKVASIRKMEKELLEKVSFNGENIAFYNETADVVLSKLGAEFGIIDTNSPSAAKWLTWFQQRFLPVYLSYIGLIKQNTGGSKASLDEDQLNEQAKLDIANKLITTSGVWLVMSGPWLGIDSGSDSSITSDNIAFLEKNAKDKKLSEEKDNSAKKIAGAIEQANPGTDKKSSQEQTPVSSTGTNKPMDSSAEKTGQWDRSGPVPKQETTKFQAGNKLAKPSSFKGFGDDIDGHIKEASFKYGIDEATLRGFVKMEAGWNNQMSPTGAIGVGQFTQGTWDALAKTPEGKEIGMTKIGGSFRTQDDPRYNKKINVLATALLAKKNSDILKNKGVDVTGENLYMVHNIGPGVVDALNGGNVNPATMKAMQLNGMKPGMTPQDFVEYQKGRFNSHYESANGSSNTPSKEAPRTVANAEGPKEAIKVYNEAKTNSASVNSSSLSSYAGSAERTKQNQSVANVPQFQNEILPKKADDFAQAMKLNREMFSKRTTPNVDPQIIASTQMNNSISTMTSTLVDSLSVQKQMLSVLEGIASGVDKVGSRVNAPTNKETISTDTPPAEKINNKGPSRGIENIPKGPVNTSRK